MITEESENQIITFSNDKITANSIEITTLLNDLNLQKDDSHSSMVQNQQELDNDSNEKNKNTPEELIEQEISNDLPVSKTMNVGFAEFPVNKLPTLNSINKFSESKMKKAKPQKNFAQLSQRKLTKINKLPNLKSI